jgi:hypothetical protein
MSDNATILGNNETIMSNNETIMSTTVMSLATSKLVGGNQLTLILTSKCHIMLYDRSITIITLFGLEIIRKSLISTSSQHFLAVLAVRERVRFRVATFFILFPPFPAHHVTSHSFLALTRPSTSLVVSDTCMFLHVHLSYNKVWCDT